MADAHRSHTCHHALYWYRTLPLCLPRAALLLAIDLLQRVELEVDLGLVRVRVRGRGRGRGRSTGRSRGKGRGRGRGRGKGRGRGASWRKHILSMPATECMLSHACTR